MTEPVLSYREEDHIGVAALARPQVMGLDPAVLPGA